MGVFKNLGHLAMRVKDLQTSLDFYTKLGFPEMTRLLNDKGEPWIVYLRITDDEYLELFPGGVGELPAAPNQVGIFHICLTVESIEDTLAHLAKAGIPLSRPRREARGIDGNRGMWIEDPDGNQIEVMEMAPDCIQMKAIERLRREPVA